MVKEEVREVVERFIAYRQRIVSVVRVLEQAPRGALGHGPDTIGGVVWRSA